MDAEAWNRRYAESALVWSAEPNRFVATELAGLAPGRAIDLAAGEGRNAIWLASIGWRVTAVDFSPVALDKGRRIAAEQAFEVDWVVADLHDWQPEPGVFDLVLIAYLHVPPALWSTVLGSAADAVAPGGTLLVVGHDIDNLTEGVGGPQDAERLYDPAAIAAALSELTVERADRVRRPVDTDAGPHDAIDTLVRAFRGSAMTAPIAATPASIKRVYYILTIGNTLAASLIWGINTIFLLDAGLNNLEAFAANAFFTAGMVLFEVPTGIVADLWGRRASFLLGTITLAVTTGLYVLLWHLHAPFWQWAVVSVLLGLGFTFFSGATEAWLVDALAATGFDGQLDAVFGRAQVAGGAAMLVGSVGGGYLAQLTNLGVPFIARAAVLAVMFVIAAVVMRDLGFTPNRDGRPIAEIKRIMSDSIEYGWRIPTVKYLMLAAPFTGGVGIYVFYALQPYLLELYGDPKAYGVAGLVAAIVSGSQIIGGFLTTWIRGRFRRRTSALITAEVLGVAAIVLIGVIANFWAVLALIVVWGLLFAAATPIRQAFINGLIPSQQRATILSFDSLMSSTGGVVTQPVLGRAADVWGYPASYVISGAISALSVPFLVLARRQKTPSDTAVTGAGTDASPEPEGGAAETTLGTGETVTTARDSGPGRA